MLFLNPSETKFRKALKYFHIGMLDFVFTRIDSLSKLKEPKFNNKYALTFVENFLIHDIDSLLISPPQNLISLHEEYKTFYSNKDILQCINYIFNYDTFISKTKTRYDAYNLALHLDINCCPYCNRNYTNTIITKKGDKISRPQFDHFFDKARHPLLAISFFNLIPSCSLCNSSLKGSANIDLDNYSHPYLDNFLDDIKFTYKYDNQSNNGLKIIIKTPENSKISKTIELFALNEIYNCHTSELKDLIKIRNSFSDKYLSILSQNTLKDINITKEELYRLAFGTEIAKDKFINKPFSKFKNDYLKELGIIE